MADLSNWDFAKTFSGIEAASLILGIDPSNAGQYDGKLVPIIERMKEDYDGALAAAVWAYEFRDSAKDNLPDQMAAPKLLYSHRMFDPTGYEAKVDCLMKGHWLKNEEETKFDKQKFSREEMARWITVTGQPSIYQFEAMRTSEQVPVETSKDIDPQDLPFELDCAMQAFRAVLNGHGDKNATFRNRLKTYLKATFGSLTPEAIERIATVANPDKSRGRPKNAAE